jgi:hypothetical protein
LKEINAKLISEAAVKEFYYKMLESANVTEKERVKLIET